MGILTLTLDPNAEPAPRHVLDKHFLRKHGPNAYYGQGVSGAQNPKLLSGFYHTLSCPDTVCRVQ